MFHSRAALDRCRLWRQHRPMHGRRRTVLIAVVCALAVGGTSALAATFVRRGARTNRFPLVTRRVPRELVDEGGVGDPTRRRPSAPGKPRLLTRTGPRWQAGLSGSAVRHVPRCSCTRSIPLRPRSPGRPGSRFVEIASAQPRRIAEQEAYSPQSLSSREPQCRQLPNLLPKPQIALLDRTQPRREYPRGSEFGQS